MRLTPLFTWIFAICLVGQTVYADIYVWDDENGITHFTNENPPPEAEIFLKTMEGPYEEAFERAQRETAKQPELERAQAEIREQEERLAEKIAQLERRTEEAEREAREALERAAELEDATDRRYRDDRWYSTGYASYYPGYDGYRHYGYTGYRFSVTYPSSKRYKRHRYRKGGSHKQIDRNGHRYRGRRLEGNRHARHRRHATGQARFDGDRDADNDRHSAQACFGIRCGPSITR